VHLARHPVSFAIQRDINARFRGILVDWLVEVAVKFRFVEDTLFTAVAITDQFLSTVEISRNSLQLVGIAGEKEGTVYAYPVYTLSSVPYPSLHCTPPHACPRQPCLWRPR
jgi:hypothetical protein